MQKSYAKINHRFLRNETFTFRKGRNMLISIVVMTYNHGKYIRQALDSILMQKRTFDIEILIGDDCSADDTPQIIAEYARNYPNIIKAVLRKHNLGATKNSYKLFRAAKGDYIAILEGDDYWTDEKKLMKQFQFLESNPEYAACCCEFRYVDENGAPLFKEKEKRLRGQLYETERIYTLKQLCESRLPSQAGTLLFKNIFLNSDINTKVIYQAHPVIGDYTLAMLILAVGKIYRLKDVMSHYRFVDKSSSSWTARTAVNPYHFYEIFMYHTYLENYAKNVLNMELHLKNTKGHALYEMVQSYIGGRTKAKKQCIKNMLQETRDKKYYLSIYLQTKSVARIPRFIQDMYSYKIHKKALPSLQKSWKQFHQELGNRKVILYGAGGGCADFSTKYYCDIPVYCIVDNDPQKQGTYFQGYIIRDSGVFDTLHQEEFVVIITVLLPMNEIAQSLYDRKIQNVYSYPVMEGRRLKYYFPRFFMKEHKYLRD